MVATLRSPWRKEPTSTMVPPQLALVLARTGDMETILSSGSLKILVYVYFSCTYIHVRRYKA